MKTSVALTLILTLFVASMLGAQFANVVEADPFFIFNLIDPVPGTIPPTITIFSPQNSTSYSSDNIAVSFEVDRPKLNSCDTAITYVNYTLDSETVQAFTIWRGGSASNAWAVPEYNTTFTLPSLTTGQHSLTVRAEGVVYAGGMDIFFIVGSSRVFFTVDHTPSSPSLSPSPAPITSPSPSPTAPSSPAQTSAPTPTSTPYQEPRQTEQQEIVIGAAITAVVIGAGLGLLIYLMKRKG